MLGLADPFWFEFDTDVLAVLKFGNSCGCKINKKKRI